MQTVIKDISGATMISGNTSYVDSGDTSAILSWRCHQHKRSFNADPLSEKLNRRSSNGIMLVCLFCVIKTQMSNNTNN